ncbi:hypothetical protein FB446DRAFT_501106 [Lentinula raphanica]|nr:hypothetical protein FB446DRAFT_501106 [Lentinula raphanica]
MRLPSSSSLVFATLAISSSSSTLSALAAPAGDHAQAQSAISASNNHDRRSSVAYPRSENGDVPQARSEETSQVERRDLISTLCGLPGVPALLGPIGLCVSGAPAAEAAGIMSMLSENATDPSVEGSPTWIPPSSDADTSNNATSSSGASSASDQPPSRRQVPAAPAPPAGAPQLPVDPSTVTGIVAGVPGKAEDTVGQAPLPQPLKDKAGTVEGTLPVSPGQIPSMVAGKIPSVVKDKAGTVEGAVPQPIKDKAGAVLGAVPVSPPVRRSHRARRDVPSTPAGAPSPPAGAPVGAPAPPFPPPGAPAGAPSPPVQPPVPSSAASTTVTSTVTETAAPTSA